MGEDVVLEGMNRTSDLARKPKPECRFRIDLGRMRQQRLKPNIEPRADVN
jgi:hypothetical protein